MSEPTAPEKWFLPPKSVTPHLLGGDWRGQVIRAACGETFPNRSQGTVWLRKGPVLSRCKACQRMAENAKSVKTR